MVRAFAVALICFLFVDGAAASTAQFVVVNSTASKIRPGAIVDAERPLNLAAGERLTLIGEDGAVLHLHGPLATLPLSKQAAPATDDGLVQALSRLFAADPAVSSRVAWGGFRGNEPSPGHASEEPHDVWAWNIGGSDSICVPATTQPVLWRANAGPSQVVVLLHLSTGKEADVDFAAGQQSSVWPKAVPLLDGGEYAVRDPKSLWERRLGVRVIPVGEISSVRQIAWMADAGCVRQARLLITRLP